MRLLLTLLRMLMQIRLHGRGRLGLRIEMIDMLLVVPIYFKEMEPMTDHVGKAGDPKYYPRATDEVTVYYKGSYIIWE